MSRRRKEQQRKKLVAERQGRSSQDAPAPSHRKATAQAVVKMRPETLERVMDKRVPAGDVIETARVAARVAAQKTSDLVPHCPAKKLDHLHVRVEPVGKDRLGVTAEAEGLAEDDLGTEALVAVAAAALTLYDMLHDLDDAIIITDCRVIETG